MQKPTIGVILGTTRENRFGERPARWIHALAAERGDMEVEFIDLRDHPLPFYGEPAAGAEAAVRRWQQRISRLDGFVFVVAEYNRAPPAVLKNALDHAYGEWHRKPAACVGYGSVGAARAVEQVRQICLELQMAPTRAGVYVQGADYLAAAREGRDLGEFPHLRAGATTMLDELLWWTRALKTAREAA